MAGRKSDFTLTRLDDLFTTQAQREEERLSKIRDIPLELIDDFPDHPFKVRDDEDMQQLVESIKERGVITPRSLILSTSCCISSSSLTLNGWSGKSSISSNGISRILESLSSSLCACVVKRSSSLVRVKSLFLPAIG